VAELRVSFKQKKKVKSDMGTAVIERIERKTASHL